MEFTEETVSRIEHYKQLTNNANSELTVRECYNIQEFKKQFPELYDELIQCDLNLVSPMSGYPRCLVLAAEFGPSGINDYFMLKIETLATNSQIYAVCAWLLNKGRYAHIDAVLNNPIESEMIKQLSLK